MTATNKCYNFVGFGYRVPWSVTLLSIRPHTIYYPKWSITLLSIRPHNIYYPKWNNACRWHTCMPTYNCILNAMLITEASLVFKHAPQASINIVPQSMNLWVEWLRYIICGAAYKVILNPLIYVTFLWIPMIRRHQASLQSGHVQNQPPPMRRPNYTIKTGRSGDDPFPIWLVRKRKLK